MQPIEQGEKIVIGWTDSCKWRGLDKKSVLAYNFIFNIQNALPLTYIKSNRSYKAHQRCFKSSSSVYAYVKIERDKNTHVFLNWNARTNGTIVQDGLSPGNAVYTASHTSWRFRVIWYRLNLIEHCDVNSVFCSTYTHAYIHTCIRIRWLRKLTGAT